MKKKQPQVSALFQSLGLVQSSPAVDQVRVDTNTSSKKDFRLAADGLLTVAPKKMTFTQVDELVSELIETKMQSDVNHLLNRLPKKTMEGHLNELFMNKFGVKKVVLENLQSFLYYLKVYSPMKTRLRAFLHVLRNECEEEFLHALKCVEKTLGLLLKLFLNSNNPYLTEQKVDAVLRKKFQSNIEHTEAVMIVEYLYNRQDAKKILGRIDDFLARQHHEEPAALTRKDLYLLKEDQQTKCIKYKEFSWIVTDFVLDSHLRFLSPFVRAFRTLDAENSGYVDEVAPADPDPVPRAARQSEPRRSTDLRRGRHAHPHRPLLLQPDDLLDLRLLRLRDDHQRTGRRERLGKPRVAG